MEFNGGDGNLFQVNLRRVFLISCSILIGIEVRGPYALQYFYDSIQHQLHAHRSQQHESDDGIRLYRDVDRSRLCVIHKHLLKRCDAARCRIDWAPRPSGSFILQRALRKSTSEVVDKTSS